MDSTKLQTSKDIFDLVRSDLVKVEEELSQQSVSTVRPITEIGQYLQLSGGKRLRPTLLLISSKICEYDGPSAIRLSAVMELIHTATLIHDDVIDEAETRRGHPSTNSRWGNHTCVLAGDWLYMQAFNIALAERNFKILDVLIGLTQVMVEGELLQLNQLKRLDLTQDDYLDLAYRKTACLFSACLRLGALLGDKNEEFELALASYGANLGLAFQVIDDLLDFTSSEETLGKPIGSDLREGKVTLPLIHLLARCSSSEAEKIARVLGDGGFHSVQFSEILDMIERYGVLTAARAKAQQFASMAERSLQGLPESPYRHALRLLAELVVDRQY
ncbi:MAG TPA: polyprenyl synthetase family protein [Terriglobia bacterium]|nr:polyprenyl synthetase family protein [Terriglobia bacterium]